MSKPLSLDHFNKEHPAYVEFPNPQLADEDGLLGSGANLAPTTLLSAYLQGIFPWFNKGEPILWWSPNPRLIIPTDKFHVSRRLRSKLKKQEYSILCNTAFVDVMTHCASHTLRRNLKISKVDGSHTWISEQIIEAYRQLYELGYAHSVEIWRGDELVGGIYGLSINGLFFGESMFSKETDTSKIALFYLCEFLKINDCPWIDCQVESAHLKTLGATTMLRSSFIKQLNKFALEQPNKNLPWNNFASFSSSIIIS